MNAIHAGEIRGMYIEGENPAMSDPDLNHAREALAKLEHLVVQDLFLTETAFHADVILPASAFAEKAGTFTNTDRRVQMARPVCRRPARRGRIWWIIQEIARRIGLDWNYDGPRDVFAEMAQVMPSLQTHHLGAAGARRRGDLSGRRAGQARQRDHLRRRAFRPRAGAPGSCPANLAPPDEVPDDDYPMVLSTGRVLEHWHTGSMTRRADVLDAIEPEAVAFMSPQELRRLGVAAGDCDPARDAARRGRR